MTCKQCFVCRPVSRIWHRYDYPPWIMGTTVTISPSCTRDSLTSKMDEWCFSYVKEEHPIIFLQLPSSRISIKNLYLCLSDSRLKALSFHDPLFSSISWLGRSMAS